MKRLRLLLVCWILSLAWSPSGLVAQEDSDILNRERDEAATSIEERQRTVTILLEAARAARQSGDLVKAARALNRAGRLQLLLSLPQAALQTYQEALGTLPDPHAETRIDSLNGMAAVYTLEAKCKEAQSYSEKAIDLSEKTKYVPGKAQALLTFSDCQNRINHALALSTALESLALWQSVNDRWGMGKSYSAIGHYQLTLQNLAEATRSHEAALGIWRELNVRDEEAQALINLAFIEYRKGAWQSVISLHLQAQRLLDEKSHPYEMGQITINLGETFIETGMPEAGLVNFKQAEEYFRQSQDPLAVAVASWGIGKAYYALNNYPEAVATLQRTIAAAEKIHEPNLIGMCHESLGLTYLAINEPETALLHYETALDIFIRVSGPMEAARVRARMGQIYHLQKEYGKANAFYQRALAAFRTLSDHVNESATLYAVGRLRLDQRDLDAAETYLRHSLEVTEDIRRLPTTSDLTAGFSATVHERYETYVECLMRKHAIDPSLRLDVLAFQTSEWARGRSLAELLRTTQTNPTPRLDPQLAREEKSLRQTLQVKENYKVSLLGRKHQQEELTTLESEVASLEKEYQQVIETINARSPAYRQIDRPTGWELSQIQGQVVADDQTVLLEYSLGVEHSYVWIVTRSNITSRELPPKAVITPTAQEVYRLLRTAPAPETDKQLNAAIRSLSAMVLEPVSSELKNRVIVVADGALHYIPFQILRARPDNDEPLVAACEIINAPSASILGQLREENAQRQRPAQLLAAFGDPIFATNDSQSADDTSDISASLQPLESTLRDIDPRGDSFDPAEIKRLFYAGRELRNLLKAASAGGTFMATKYDATRERLQSTDLSQYAILHFATHGYYNPKRPENSGLVLSTVGRDRRTLNGFLGLQDIYNLRAPVDLVVMSACTTGLGKDVRGEGLIGLTRGFMYAGASSVVASLWEVDDAATAELMKRFYTKMLQEGRPPGEALRAAQNSIRHEPGWSSPYYWAAFTLQGENSRPIKAPPAAKTPTHSNIMLFGGLALLFAVMGWSYHRHFRM